VPQSAFGDRVALRRGDDGGWRERTFAEVGELVDGLALGLVVLGLEPGDRACILANTSPEWTLASLAISRAGGVVVPIYPTDSPEECEWEAGNSEARMIICEDALQADKIAQVRQRLERVEHVIVIDRAGVDNVLSLEGSSWGDRLANGARARPSQRHPLPARADHLHLGHHRPAQGCRADGR
jgi:long-chain acyl-CoA synthetase